MEKGEIEEMEIQVEEIEEEEMEKEKIEEEIEDVAVVLGTVKGNLSKQAGKGNKD